MKIRLNFIQNMVYTTLKFIEYSDLAVSTKDNGRAIFPKVRKVGYNKLVITIDDEIFEVVVSKRKGK